MNTLTLPTGRVLPLDYLDFSEATQTFFYGGLDVTPYMTRAQKVAAGGGLFDVDRANREASDAARDAAGLPRVPEGEQSTTRIFVEGVGNDLSKLATDTRDVIGLGQENAGNGSPLLRYALAALVLFVVWKVGVLDWVKKKLTA
jgi:hypothetical protein